MILLDKSLLTRPHEFFDQTGRRRRVTRPDQDAPGFIRREALALDEFVFERFQGLSIELKLQLEGALRQAAPLT